ncbi:MAG: hypothetical protein AAFX06_00190 [Planctomycetota bacterium]
MIRKVLSVACVIALSTQQSPGQTDALGGRTVAASIARAAADSVDALDPNRIAEIEPATDAFLMAVESLRGHLSRTADPSNADAWIRYLGIDDVVEGIEDDVSEAALAKLAFTTSKRGVGIHPGLEIDAVVRVRDAASDLSNALRFRKREAITKVLAKRLGLLAEEWASVGSVPSASENEGLRLILGLLEKTGQDVPLTARTRSLYRYPNLQVLVSGRSIEEVVRRPVDQPSPVRDCILGTRLIGNARLCGDVTAILMPSIGSVRMQLVMNGTVESRNTGYNGPVRLQTSSQGQVQATRSMTITESGVTLDPVSTSGTLRSQVNRIEHRLRIVRRIARRKAAEQKPLSESIAKRKMLDRVADGFAEQTDAAVSKPMPDLMAQARPWLRRLDLAEPTRLIGSTSDSVYLTGTVRRDEQLASATPPPPVSPLYDAAFQIHESLINNTAGPILGGRTMTRSELAALAQKAGNAPQAAPEEEDFELDFDPVRPIIFEARDGKLRVGIRMTRFKQGKTERRQTLEVTATYQPVYTTTGQVMLERVGDAKVDFPGKKKVGIREAGLRGAVKDSIAEAFPSVLLDQPILLPADFKLPALANQQLSVRQFEAREGWLTVGVGR